MLALGSTFNFLSIQYVCLLLPAAARRSLLKGNFVLGHRRKRGKERALGKHPQKKCSEDSTRRSHGDEGEEGASGYIRPAGEVEALWKGAARSAL